MLFRLLKNAGSWAFKYIEKSSQGIAEAEDRFVASMFKEEIDDESN